MPRAAIVCRGDDIGKGIPAVDEGVDFELSPGGQGRTHCTHVIGRVAGLSRRQGSSWNSWLEKRNSYQYNFGTDGALTSGDGAVLFQGDRFSERRGSRDWPFHLLPFEKIRIFLFLEFLV